MKQLVILIVLGLTLVGCSDDKTDKVEQHVWQEQTDMIDKAKDVEGMVLDSANKQREMLE